MPAPDGATLAHLDREQCLSLLASKPVGRLVFTYRALPDVIPVNYRVDRASLLLRLSGGSVAASATKDAVVAFEVDEIDLNSHTGWSVTVVGHAREIIDPMELRRVRALNLVSWAGDDRDHFVSVALEQVTGRQLFSTGTSPGQIRSTRPSPDA